MERATGYGGGNQGTDGIRRAGAEISGQPEEAMRYGGGDRLWRMDGMAIGSFRGGNEVCMDLPTTQRVEGICNYCFCCRRCVSCSPRIN